MATFLVTYDLHNKRDYPRLIEAIEKLTDSAKLLESVWLVVSEKNPIELKEHLLKFMDADDSIAVLPVPKGYGYATTRCLKQGRDWIVRNLKTD